MLKYVCVCVCVCSVVQSCLTLCNPMYGCLSGSSVYGIFQARILEWVAISFFNKYKWYHTITSFSWTAFLIVSDQIRSDQSLSRVQLFATPWIAARQASLSVTKSRSSMRLNVHRVSDAIQPSHPLSSPSPPAPQSLPASGSFPVSQLFTWGGQSTGVSALALASTEYWKV